MNTPSSTANGARLDDCHSTVFSLADLSGIKWQKYSSDTKQYTDDPVLSAFTKCLSCDILAVWRRSPKKTSNSAASQLGELYEKELWIFWWGDEPQIKEIAGQKGLKGESGGSWEEGLSYECRTLLFKAIHNLVERCLLNEQFVRIGRWFIKPLCKDGDEDISDRFSFSFSFFLHGESSVCTTVEVAKHQNLERLSYQHIQQFLSSSGRQPKSIVLAPYGLDAKLTGRVYKSPHEPNVKRLLDEWKPFYPLANPEDLVQDDECSDEDGGDDQIPVPPVVEIVVGGIPMNYPSHFVLLPAANDFNDNEALTRLSSPSDKGKCGPSSVPVETPGTGWDRTPVNGPMSVSSVADRSFIAGNVASNLVANRGLDRDRTDRTKLSWKMLKRVRARGRKNLSKVEVVKNSALDESIQRSVSMNIKIEPGEVPESNAPSPLRWGFSDSYHDIRSTYTANHPTATEERRPGNVERQQRLSVSQPFHRRTLCSDTINPTTASIVQDCNENGALPRRIPEAGNDLGDNAQILPASFVSLNKSTSQIGDTGDKLLSVKLMTPDPGAGDVSRPFVNLTNADPPCAFDDVNQSAIVAESSTAQVDIEDSLEMRRVVGEWVTYKLPGNHADHSRTAGSAKVPPLHRDGLDPAGRLGMIAHGAGSDFSAFYSCPSRKRLKVSGAEPGALQLKLKDERGSAIEDFLHFPTDPSGSQHVTVGTVKGELAGMVVAPDPYAFDDELDDTTTAPSSMTSSDIILKKGTTIQQAPWPPSNSPWPHGAHLSNSLPDPSIVKTESPLSNRSQLETLLTQNTYSPVGAADASASNPSFVGTRMSQSDLKFSMEDLERGVFDDEDAGVPTPPDDDEEPSKQLHAYQHPVPPSVTTDTVTANLDLQRIYPTPPSLEAFSPEVRPVPQVGANDAMSSPQEQSVTSVHKNTFMDMERHEHIAHQMHGDMMIQMNTSQQVEAQMLCKTTRVKKHPSSTVYQPVLCLSSQLPRTSLSYTPTWQLPPSMPPPVQTLPSSGVDYLNYQPVTPATPLAFGVTPGTPGRSSIKTPASVPAPSPAPTPRTPRTPGRGGIASVEMLESPASSMATPSSHRTPRRTYFDQHDNAAIFMNLLLSDSVLNLFRDRSFDQCTLCVCNTNTNITGADVGMGYLPAIATQEDLPSCTCGFSAVRNRIASVGSGLFLEDELDVVGKRFENIVVNSRPHFGKNASEPAARNGQNSTEIEDGIMQIAMDHCSSPFNVADVCQQVQPNKNSVRRADNVIVQHDIREAFAQALSGGLLAMEQPTKIDADNFKSSPIHPWKESQCDVLTCASTLDIHRLLVSLKPVLQDAIQKKRTSRSFGTTQHVKGPLTWREFCKEAGKNAEPQPIPSFVVGHDQDWICVSPHALRYWEKLFLEPYSRPRDVAYIAVCPNEEHAVSSTKTFFKELGFVYESCRLGRLRPVNKVLRNSGILRVGSNVSNSAEATADGWLDDYINTVNAQPGVKRLSDDDKRKLKSYVQACVGELGDLLRDETSLEIFSLYVSENRSRSVQANSLSNSNNNRNQSMHGSQTPSGKENRPSALTSYNASTAASIVLYFLDPFHGAMSRCLWRCFFQLRKSLPRPLRDHVVLQILPMERILQATSSTGQESFIRNVRSLAFSTFAQCRRIIPHEVRVRSMTDFGPAAKERQITKGSKITDVTSLYSPPYILHVPRKRLFEASVAGKSDEDFDVLFVSYCLSHDQKYVLASATDQCGELLETCCINISVPSRRLLVSRKHRTSVRGEAIKKLWQFCVTTVTQLSTRPWRVVIGRLGRLSHGEIRDWAKYLNLKSLIAVGKANGCSQCKLQHTPDSSVIVSACLTSMEPDGALMLMPDVVQTNNFGRSSSTTSQNTVLKTPDDVSCTHLYVFPTSAAIQSPGADYQAGTEEDPSASENMLDMIFSLGEDDLFLNELMVGDGSPAANQPTFSIGDDDPMKAPNNEAHGGSGSEDNQLSQQPLALGYLVSTAPAGPLPSWFWTTCPDAQRRCPVFLRSALHIQTSTVEPGSIGVNSKKHPLDSNKTEVILRFVLESYNALSWLSRDPVTRDRRSCLPVHFLSLLQLYHLIQNLL